MGASSAARRAPVAILLLLALLPLGVAVAHARTRVGMTALSWHPRVEPARALATRPAREPRPTGTYLGPIYVDGDHAQLLRRLPASVRRPLSAPVGVSPFFVDYGGFGLAVYCRIAR
jgi:hypothetical protein